MKLTTVFACALLLAFVNVANAVKCKPMSKKDKAMYEDVLEAEFMGCTLSTKEGMTALGRIHWMTPKGGQPIVEMDHSAEVDMEGMGKKKDMDMVMTGMKVAGASVGRPGALTVTLECLASCPPDMVYSSLADSKDSKTFNAELNAMCEGKSVRTINTSVRADATTIAAGEAVTCVITAILSLFFPILTPNILAVLKTIVTTTFTVLPCPSDMARMVLPTA